MTVYGSVAAFRAYHTARNRDTAAYDDGEVQGALLVASEWLDARYHKKFPGTKVGLRSQVREWPRVGGIDRDGYSIAVDSVPTEVENATYEATLRVLITPGSLSVDYKPNKYESASVDGAVAVRYRNFDSASEVQTQFTVIDEILNPILTVSNISPLSGGSSR